MVALVGKAVVQDLILFLRQRGRPLFDGGGFGASGRVAAVNDGGQQSAFGQQCGGGLHGAHAAVGFCGNGFVAAGQVAEVEHGGIQRFADVIGQIGMAGGNQFHSFFNAVFAQ